MTRARSICLFWIALALLAGALAGIPIARAQDSEQSTLASLLSWALSTPESRVTVGAVEGALSSNAVIRDVRIADNSGVWLTIDRARLVWSRLALLSRRLEIDALEIDTLTIARRPGAQDEAGAQPAQAPTLPDLPVKVIVKRFDMKQLVLGEPVLGTPARIAAQGATVLGNPAEGLSLSFEARRLDAPGRFSAVLAYAPATTQLNLDIDFDEPAGGLFARIARIPGEPPVRLKLAGSGPLDGFAATLAFQSGPDIGAEGRATLAREGTGRRLELALAARVAALFPAPIAPIFAGTTTLSGDIVIADAGAVALRRLELAASAVRLDVSGQVSATRELDLSASLRSVTAPGGVTRAGAAEVGRLVLDASIRGRADAPRINATLALADLVTPRLRVKAASGSLDADPGSPAAPLHADLSASGIWLDDAGAQAALGDRLDAHLEGRFLDAGLDLDRLSLASPSGELQFKGQLAQRYIDGTASAALALTPFSTLVGRPLGGDAALSARIEGDPSRHRLAATLDGKLTDARFDIKALDGLLAGSVAVKGAVRQVPGGLTLEALRLEGPHLALRLDGTADERAIDLTADATVPELKQADPRISGRLRASLRLTGRPDRLDAKGFAALAGATGLGRPIPRLDLSIDARDVTGAFEADFSASGLVDGKPATGKARLSAPGGGLAVQGLDVAVGSVSLVGDLRMAANRLASGALRLAADEMSDIAPLLLTPLSGKAQAALTLADPGGRQDASLSARAERLRLSEIELQRLDISLDGRDLRQAPVIEGSATADEVTAGGQRFTALRLTSRIQGGASLIDATARGPGFDLDGRGRLLPGPPPRLELTALAVAREAQRLSLARPATLTFEPEGLAIRDLVLRSGPGQIAIEGRAGRPLDLTLEAKALPLATLSILAPTIVVEGVADGRAVLSGSPDRIEGPFRLTLKGVTSPTLRQAGLTGMELRAAGKLADGRVELDSATLISGKALSLTATGSLPLAAAGRLDLRLRGTADAALANASLGTGGRRLAGRVGADLGVSGTFAAPRLSGSATLSSGSFEDPLAGIKLQPIEARVVAEGTTLRIERLTAKTVNGGVLQGSGRVTLDFEGGLPADIRVTGRNARLISSDLVSATADLAVQVTGPLARAPRLSGRIDITAMDVAIPERLTSVPGPLPSTRHVKPGPAAAARLRQQSAERRAAAAGPAFVAALDLNVSARNRIFVRGRGLEAELGGALALRGTTAAPLATGGFALRNGRIDIAGQRIDLVRGALSFTGSLIPALDFTGEVKAGDVTAQILVSGPADAPEFTITSRPELPQDEVLSRILFGRAAGELTGFQALMLAQSVAQLAGSSAGSFDGLRRSLGVDSLDVSSSARGGPALGLARRLGDRVRIGVKAGANAADTGLGIDIDLGRGVKLRGQAGADGSGSAGIATEWEY